MKQIKLILFLLIFNTVISGCTPVAAWERGNLAKPQMALDPTPMQGAIRSHIYGSREASSGGNVSSGGGCGCY
jgi:hypothetical protein